MAVPILLVSGFLGAGKTTLINRLLADPQGRRLAAVVNDFGAIDIDAELLGSVADGVFSLKNGCICCSLQGDLLRTLSTILRRDAALDGIVIETSGVSDPAEIIRNLLDPVIFKEAALDAVVCLADCRHLLDRPDLLDDVLCKSQLRSADFILLSKTDLVTAEERQTIRDRLSAFKPARMIFDVQHGDVPAELLFSAGLHQPGPAAAKRPVFSAPAFQTMDWTADCPLSLPLFQRAISRLAPQIIRAKGILVAADQPGRPLLFQMVGGRATISPAPAPPPGAALVRLVLIGPLGAFDPAAVTAELDGCVTADTVRA
jgi:cobalamin biosynthesis protein CobW